MTFSSQIRAANPLDGQGRNKMHSASPDVPHGSLEVSDCSLEVPHSSPKVPYSSPEVPHSSLEVSYNSLEVVDAALIAAPSSTKNREKSRDPEMHSGKGTNGTSGTHWYERPVASRMLQCPARWFGSGNFFRAGFAFSFSGELE
jgi:hypothetical protein